MMDLASLTGEGPSRQTIQEAIAILIERWEVRRSEAEPEAAE